MSDSDSQRMLSLGAALGFLPVAAMQRARLRLGAASTPLPVGASEVEVGELSAPFERLLVLGDASALGAGCDEVEAALAPRLAFGVALRRRTRIHWTARGGAGWTAARLDADLQRRGVPAADAALLVIGVNDALAMTPLTAWRRQLDRIVTRLFVAGVRLVAVSGLPPVQRLPGLAWPLAPLLALRVAQLDRAARRIAHPSPLARSGPSPTCRSRRSTLTRTSRKTGCMRPLRAMRGGQPAPLITLLESWISFLRRRVRQAFGAPCPEASELAREGDDRDQGHADYGADEVQQQQAHSAMKAAPPAPWP